MVLGYDVNDVVQVVFPALGDASHGPCGNGARCRDSTVVRRERHGRSDDGVPAEPTFLLEWATVLSATMRAAVRAGHPALFHAAATDRAERIAGIRLSFNELIA